MILWETCLLRLPFTSIHLVDYDQGSSLRSLDIAKNPIKIRTSRNTKIQYLFQKFSLFDTSRSPVALFVSEIWGTGSPEHHREEEGTGLEYFSSCKMRVRYIDTKRNTAKVYSFIQKTGLEYI